MRLQRSASIVALIAAGAITPSAVGAQQVVVGPSITISPSSANVLNLLGPYLGLNADQRRTGDPHLKPVAGDRREQQRHDGAAAAR